MCRRQGCLHHKLRRHHVALHYFQKALEALGKGPAAAANGGEAAAAGRGGGKDGHVSPAPTCEVLYNTGLQLLLTQKPEQVCGLALVSSPSCVRCFLVVVVTISMYVVVGW